MMIGTAMVRALFLVATASTGVAAGEAVVRAASQGGTEWLVALYVLLKMAVVIAFTVFIFARQPSRRRSRSAAAWLTCAVAILSVVLVTPPDGHSSAWFVVAGDAIALVGCLFVLVSVLTLRTCFGVLPEVRGLVTRGPYRLVRHPVYLGEMAAFVGFVLAAPRVINGVLFVTFVLAQSMRMRMEEAALTAEFPEYADYARRTNRLVPRLRPAVLRALTTAGGAATLMLVLIGGAVAKPAGPRAPVLQSPSNDAVVADVPSFTWKGARGATRYEFQVAADRGFGSPAFGDHRTSMLTRNTAATVTRRLADGVYYWRVRSVDSRDNAGRWSAAHSFRKSWSTRPVLLAPAADANVHYPAEPLVLSWSPVPTAHKYSLVVATDPSLASPVLGADAKPIVTSATSFALLEALPHGKYYWAVTPQDARGHKGARSAVGSFTWSWPTKTNAHLNDLNDDARVFDPQLAWDPVPGAARYEVEVSYSEDFAPGSIVCCDDLTTGTSLSPRKLLQNNRYYWRVRPLDLDGNAGAWTLGPAFKKAFDDVTPTIPGLRLRDNAADPAVDLAPGVAPAPTTSHPVVAWSPVPGASSYDVQVVPHKDGACNWTETSPTQYWSVRTASTAWTPLSGSWNQRLPGGVSFPAAANDMPRAPVSGATYCVRVAARTDRDAGGREIVSEWTQLGGLGNPGFRYVAPEPGVASGTLAAAANQYLGPQTGTTLPRTPLFTWRPIPGARSYFVVVAKDAGFTEIVDVAITQVAAYAPRSPIRPTTYPDETTAFYWAVVPASGANGDGVSTQPTQNHPQSFHKRSVPPALLQPKAGDDVWTQPTFRWTSVEAAREYRLQVSQDPTFSDLIDDVTTTSSAFTSSSTYPVDTTLYWRVRANDENKIGLAWSEPGQFRRRLASPAAVDGNPTSGDTAPVISWKPVQGAVSYNLHIDQPDGASRDFTLRSPTFAFTAFYGTGVFRMRLRANFPKLPLGTTPGPWTQSHAFTRFMAAPANAKATLERSRVLASWDPYPGAHHYRVEFATSDTFARPIDVQMTDNTSYAPDLSKPGFVGGGQLFWRVAVVDEGNNLGAQKLGTARLPRGLVVRVAGGLLKGVPGTVTVTVLDGRGRAVRGARVSVRGRGTRAPSVRTGRNGRARLRVSAARRGTLVVRATRKGYRAGTAKLPVR